MSQELRDALFVGTDSRSNFKQILAKRSDLAKFAGGRMVTPGADTTYEAGLVLGQVTATGKLKPWNAANTDGSEVAVGVLAEQAEVTSTGDGTEISYLRGGTIYGDLVVAPSTAWKADLGAKSYVEHGVNLVDF